MTISSAPQHEHNTSIKNEQISNTSLYDLQHIHEHLKCFHKYKHVESHKTSLISNITIFVKFEATPNEFLLKSKQYGLVVC